MFQFLSTKSCPFPPTGGGKRWFWTESVSVVQADLELSPPASASQGLMPRAPWKSYQMAFQFWSQLQDRKIEVCPNRMVKDEKKKKKKLFVPGGNASMNQQELWCLDSA